MATETCEHGNPMDGECNECARYADGSDGTMAGDHRAAVKHWQAYLAEQERQRQELWPDE